jgi:PAB-dependent poly(A)-specific ribonuclease subunit 3
MAKNVPLEAHAYHSLLPLDTNERGSSKRFGVPTSAYKATSSIDGLVYAFRRLEGFRLHNEVSMNALEPWTRLQHANIVSVREAFTTKAFSDDSLVFVYDYFPNAVTLATKHFPPIPSSSGKPAPTHHPEPVTEEILWSYIVQITSALRTIHASGLAFRMLDPTKILVTGKNRVRLNCCAIFDVVTFDGATPLNPVPFQVHLPVRGGVDLVARGFDCVRTTDYLFGLQHARCAS